MGDFEPMPGWKMKGYVAMADPLDRDFAELARWVKYSLAFARKVPQKSNAGPKAKKIEKTKAVVRRQTAPYTSS
jgi:hypothetical protein